MRNGIAVNVAKNATGTYYVWMTFDRYTLASMDFLTKAEAVECQKEVRARLDRLQMTKIKATLTDVHINTMIYEEYPVVEKLSIMDTMIVDLLRKHFVKTAKLIRDKFLEINLKFENEDDE